MGGAVGENVRVGSTGGRRKADRTPESGDPADNPRLLWPPRAAPPSGAAALDCGGPTPLSTSATHPALYPPEI